MTDAQKASIVAQDPRYAALFGFPAPEPRNAPCVSLGLIVSPRSNPCWKLAAHECDAGRGQCRPGVECQTCTGYVADDPHADDPPPAPPGPPRRHLLHHVLPVARNGVWQRNADQIIARMGLFTGRRVVAVATATPATAKELDPPDAVREYYARHAVEVVEVPNNPTLREVATWPALWDRLREFADTDDAVFYSHAKGVTRPVNPGVTCHPWARMLYASLLDHWPAVEAQLKLWPIAGSFKKVGHGFQGSRSSWHYSGSFFWIRAREAFKADRVRRIDRRWWGNESWPGCHFPPEHAGVLFHEGRVPALDMYSPAYVRGVLREFETWSQATPRSAIG